MMIIDGKAIAQAIRHELAEEVAQCNGRPPCLAVILTGDDPASHIYVNQKLRACKEMGITSIKRELPSTLSTEELHHEVEALNNDPEVDGILVQLPLPDHIDPNKVIEWISPEKDVDGFHPINAGKLLAGQTDGLIPCTPRGIQLLLEKSDIPTEGKHVVILGRSNIVGKPLAALLMQKGPTANATVTIAHSRTQNLAELCQSADILVAAIGNPLFVKPEMVKEGAIVIDVGTNRLDDPSRPKGYRLVGDVDFDQVADKCSYITPVPGGVGPMTIAMLLSNTLQSYKQRKLP